MGGTRAFRQSQLDGGSHVQTHRPAHSDSSGRPDGVPGRLACGIPVSDGTLTLAEVEGLPGLVKGSAGIFSEMLHPHPLPPSLGGGGHPVPKIMLNARGTLEDGRSFAVNLTRVNDGTPNVRIRVR